MEPVIVCESPRLRIRWMTLGDAGFLFRQLNEPSWLANIGDRGVRSVEGAAKYIETRTFTQYRSFGFGMNVVELKSTAQPIGVCGLVKREYLPFPDLGFALLETYWGQGYAHEAAAAVIAHAQDVLKIPCLFAITVPANVRSGRLLGKLGFRIESEEHVTPEGEKLRLYSVSRPQAESGHVRRASCHCGAVEFELDLPNGLEEVRRCNCSFCRMRGAIAASVPLSGLRILKGAEKLTLYQFNTKTAKHYFCSVCGVYTQHQRRSKPWQYGFNVACLEGVNAYDLEPVPVLDGINHPSDRTSA